MGVCLRCRGVDGIRPDLRSARQLLARRAIGQVDKHFRLILDQLRNYCDVTRRFCSTLRTSHIPNVIIGLLTNATAFANQ